MKRLFGKFMLIVAAIATALSALSARADEAEQHPPIQFILRPARAPRAALKYLLLPPLLDRRPGNAAIHYLKVPHEQTPLFADKEFWETLYKWTEMPLDELRKEASGDGGKYAWIAGQSGIIDMLDRGARCDSCDWDLPFREHEFYSMLLPDIQTTRSSASILAARARLQIANGKYDEAIHTLQTGYALGRHVSQGPTLVQGLVGVAICHLMSKQVDTLIQQPDAPNLYWALASLPRPLIDFRPGYDGEFASFYLFYPELRNVDKKNYSPDEWRRLLEKTVADLTRMISSDWPSSQSDLMRFAAVPMMLEGYPRAKRALIAGGRSAEEVEAMPVPQVVLIYTMHTYDELRDDTFKWFSLPYAEARQGMERADKRLKESVANGLEIIPIATNLLPAVFNVKLAEVRLNQKIAALEVIEALRMYAAEHERLPDSLKDISDVPIPLDPFRDEPFIYVRHGNSAKLESPFPDSIPLRYQIELATEGAKP